MRARTSAPSKRVIVNSVTFVLLWGAVLMMIFFGAPLWLILLIGVTGSYLALRDWQEVRSMARAQIYPPHPDLQEQGLIDGKIDISEYRERKEDLPS